MHIATQEPDIQGLNPVTKGIQQMFSTTLDGQKYPALWLEIYEKGIIIQDQIKGQQLPLF